MEIQQKDSETLTAYNHRFKKEAKHCDFDSHPAKIRIFLKGLINSSKSTRLGGINSHPQDSHGPHHMRQRTDDMDQHGHQGTPGDQQGPYAGHS